MPREGFKAVTISKDLFEELSQYLDFNREELYQAGVDSIPSLINHLLDKTKGKEIPRRLVHYNVCEDHVTIKDTKLKRLVDVYIRDKKLVCSLCESDSCIHVGYAWSIPTVVKALRD